jgi:hypothetical protein
MRDVSRTCAAVRSASSKRRDLLLETLALRQQLSVLARSNRRFRPSDRLLWLLLRWLWPRWREALSSGQVQIYEELVTDADGNYTTSFIRRNRIPKDNRLLPKGWT